MTEGQRAAVRVLLAEGKGKKVIETFAARWLVGRYLGRCLSAFCFGA
jgi:hypothetical protein